MALPASDIPQLLAARGVPYRNIDILNWPEAFPYRPEVQFAIVRNADTLLLHYRVTEDQVLARVGQDQGPVWSDSCVEFFCQPEGGDLYYNFECNCIGRLLVGAGNGREGREAAPASVLAGIDRWASLGDQPFADRLERSCWETALVIPASAFFRHGLRSFEDLRLRANFYKCGGTDAYKHYLSWAPISAPKPDFHRPEYFKPLSIGEF
ncbi:MAG: hypothetical protein K6D54_06575 [Bacteroidales bacterium]|nr:hypothetical protein [Bacteroidales bacterium]